MDGVDDKISGVVNSVSSCCALESVYCTAAGSLKLLKFSVLKDLSLICLIK